MQEWLARIRDWLRRDQLDDELSDELRFHFAQLERDARAEGRDADQSAWAARKRLGNITRVREEARARWSVPWLDQLQQDVRYALRGLRKSPGFTIGVVVTLGLGIGANAAMFGVIDHLMFRPYPYLRQPERVKRVYLQWADRESDHITEHMEYTRYLDLQRATTSFSNHAAFYQTTRAVGVGEAARERRVGAVSAGFFEFFDARPALGRFFVRTEDTTPVGASVAVLSYELWQTAFGGRDVIGQTLQVGDVPCTIIGVAPKGFIGVTENDPPALYLPITTYAGHSPNRSTYFTNYAWGWMEMMVRLKPGVSAVAATTDLTSAFVRSWNAERIIDSGRPPASVARPRSIASALKTAAGPDPGLEARTVIWVTGVAVIVLLIACANVANLSLARALRRRREVALRLALGVSRRRLVAQSLTESMLLSLIGCAFGIAIAQWGGMALRRLFIPDVSAFDLATDQRTLAVALGAAVTAGFLTSLAAILFTGRDDLTTALKAAGDARQGTYQRSRARSVLLVMQGALSVVLLVGAGLFVRSLSHVHAMRLGYDAERVLLVLRNLRGMELSDMERIALGRRLLEAAQALPDVERAAWVSSVPFWSTSNTDLFVPGVDSVPRFGRFTYETASSDYFAAMGTRILRGRGFIAADRAGAPGVAVVSEAMARTLWPGRDALGMCMRVAADTVPCTTVVGIAEDAVQNSMVGEQRFRYYLPIEQFRPEGGIGLLLRMHGDPARAAIGIRRALQRVMPGQAYVTVRPLSELVDEQRRSWQVGAAMFVAFGALALIVAAVGLYGVIAYTVAQQMHELGVRIALGARQHDVVRLVVGQGVRFAVAGVATGSLLALTAAHWVQPLLFEQSATDPSVFGMVGVLLMTVGLLASMLPALRALRADPNTVLRSE